MLEKVIEDLLANFPSEFFAEELALVDRQIRIKGRILDLLFEDSLGRLLLIEVKANALTRRDVGQAGEYYGLMKIEYPDREIRMGVFATSIEREQRIYLEAIGVEIYVFDVPALETIARKHQVDVDMGISGKIKARQRTDTETGALDRIGVKDEADYFKLIEGLNSVSQEKLAAVYGAIKKNPFSDIRFLERGRIIVSVKTANGQSTDVLFVGVDFKGPKHNPARGTLTLLWKRMLRNIPPSVLEPFAATVDDLLGRNRASEFLDPSAKAGNYDTILLERDLAGDELFGTFLNALDHHLARLHNELAEPGSSARKPDRHQSK